MAVGVSSSGPPFIDLWGIRGEEVCCQRGWWWACSKLHCWAWSPSGATRYLACWCWRHGFFFSSSCKPLLTSDLGSKQNLHHLRSCVEMKLLHLMGWMLFFWTTPNLAHALQNATSCKITTSTDWVCMSSNMKMRQFVHILSQVTLKTGRLSSTLNRRSGMINLLDCGTKKH